MNYSEIWLIEYNTILTWFKVFYIRGPRSLYIDNYIYVDV